MGYLDYAGLQYLWGKLKEKFAPKSHSHDDRYYTEAEMDGKLNSKVNNNEAGANGLINKLSTADGIPNDATVFISQHNDGKTASYYRRPISTLWTYIKSKADSVYQPKGSYAASSHSHDDRYYTESEVNGKLGGKVDNTEAGADGLLSKLTTSWTATPTDDTYFIRQDTGGGNQFGRVKFSTIWNYIKGKADGVYQPKGSYAASGHTHDDRYYTETEINSKLDGKSNTGHTHDDRYYTETEIDTKLNGKAPNGHTHQYLSLYGARPANINFTKSTNGTGAMFHFVATSSTTTGKPPDDSSILQLNWDNNGGWDSQLALSTTAKPHVYYRNQQNGTWGNWSTLLDNLNYIDYAAKKEHTHTKSQITDFPVSLKNPTALTIQTNGTTAATYDGSAAKTVNITKGTIGLGNVDNTADANKSVKYATSAGNASTATKATTADSATTSNGVKDYNDANKTIKIGFAGAGLTAENLNYVAGYTDNGTKIKDVSKDVLKGWIGLGNYLPLNGGTMSGQITKSTGGSWIGDRDRAAIKSGYAGDSSYGAVAAMATKNGYWTMGNLGGNESLIFNYSTDAKYNAGKNETSQVYLPAQAGTIITSATIGSQSVNYANSAGTANVANSVDWSKVQNKPSSYAPTSHTHDDRYYTESEVNTKLANYQPKGNYAAASHTHNYAGSGSAGGSANSAIKLDSSAGSATQPVYFSGGKPVAIGYTIAKSVPADAKFTDTDTWRGIQNNLTSDSTDQSLSAAQGKALKTLVDGKAPISHTHKKSQITDFPSSMPASDVSAWAKAATKPSYTKAEVGLSNVDNTADKNKNVKFATSAGSATNAQCLNNDSQYMRFHWNGQSGQPSWLWGGSDASNMYVYNPSNFSVNYANSAGTTLDAPYTITYEGTYTGTGEYTGSASLPIRHTLSKSYDLVYFIKNLKGRYTPGLINLFSQGNYGKQYVAMNMLPTTFTLITDLSPNIITMYNGGSNTSTSGQWANRNYIRRNGNSIEFYSTYSSNNADYFFNDKYTSYYIFGFNLNHSLFHYDV